MYAVIKTGGKQYKVSAGDVLAVEKLTGEPGSNVTFADVLLVGDEKSQTIGTPLVDGATVTAEVLEQGRGAKIIVFKKKRRKNYRRKAGHRQFLTTLRITDVTAKGGRKAAAKTVAKTDDKVANKPAEEKKAAPKTAEKPAVKKPAPAKKASPAKKATPAKKVTAAKKADAKKADDKSAEKE